MKLLSAVSRSFRSFFSFLKRLNILPCGNRHSRSEPFNELPTPADVIKNLQGEIIGPYELISEIDRGTFGAVYYCKHVDTKQSYAAKFYSLEWIRTEEGTDILENEIHVMKLLNHRNTVSFQDVIYTSNGVLIVMELVRGKTTLDLLPPGDGLMEPFARHIFVQFLDGLQYLHENRVVHRDIKLENVMIDYEGNVKIIDYGLAEYIPRNAFLSGKLFINGECGSVNYYAPEIISSNNRPFRGDLADIWASGVLLFSIVTGSFPFHQEAEDADLKVDILNCELWLKCWLQSEMILSPELKDLICKIFVKDPNERPSIAELKRHPWTKGTKLIKVNDELNTFTSSSGNVTVNFGDHEVERCHSCDFISVSRAAPPTRERIPDSKTSKIQRSSSSPHIFILEARGEDTETRPKRSDGTELSQSRRRKLGKALRHLCSTPIRGYNKIRLTRNTTKNGMHVCPPVKGSRASLTIVEHVGNACQ